MTLADHDLFRHEALLYAGRDDFVARMADFARDALAAREPIMVMVRPEKIAWIRESLGADAAHVGFADMAEIGRNPSRIIPAWRAFIESHGGSRVRGVGEPIWSGRSDDELVESQRHEALLNLAFAGHPAWILCPYDESSLGEDVLEEAFRSHPLVTVGDDERTSRTYIGPGKLGPFDAPLSPVPEAHEELAFGGTDLGAVRRFVSEHARAFGLGEPRLSDLILAVNEVAANSIRYGGGSGALALWRDGTDLVLEVRDSGRLDHPLAGRQRPPSTSVGGFGLWLVNQVCDLVQVRVTPRGSTIRLRMVIA